MKLVSAYRGYVETSFNVPPGTLKLEKKPSFKLTPGGMLKLKFQRTGGYVETRFSLPGGTFQSTPRYFATEKILFYMTPLSFRPIGPTHQIWLLLTFYVPLDLD